MYNLMSPICWLKFTRHPCTIHRTVRTMVSHTAPRQMELYASGFNAWNQLIFKSPASHDEPEDLHKFTCVLTGNAIEYPRAYLSHTTGKLHKWRFETIPVVVAIIGIPALSVLPPVRIDSYWAGPAVQSSNG